MPQLRESPSSVPVGVGTDWIRWQCAALEQGRAGGLRYPKGVLRMMDCHGIANPGPRSAHGCHAGSGPPKGGLAWSWTPR